VIDTHICIINPLILGARFARREDIFAGKRNLNSQGSGYNDGVDTMRLIEEE